MSKKIILTGGGTAGHVTPNLALLPRLRAEGYEIHYIGTADGIEKSLVDGLEGVTYHTISAGKLRRYFSLKNLTDPFKVVGGIFQAKRIINKVKPDVVFSKGGFVSVPVVIAAKGMAPIVAHESDYTPGLANKITARFADRVCVTFEDTLKYVGAKGVHTGTPIRPELYRGDRQRGLDFTGFSGEKPILLTMGGSQGAQAINDALRSALPRLTRSFDIIHLCGKGKKDASIAEPGYVQYEYISKELPDLFAAADIILSRAGANAIFEFLALAKPALLIPLPLSASRGDQILNAESFRARGLCHVLMQEDMTAESLTNAVIEVYKQRRAIEGAIAACPQRDGTAAVMAQIHKYALNRG